MSSLPTFLSNSIVSRFFNFNPPPPPRTTHSISDLAAAAAANTPPSPPGDHISATQSDRPMLSFNSFDLESSNVANNNDQLPEWKRIGKVVQTVGLGGFGVLITLLVNTPISAATHFALYTAYLTVVCLGFLTSIGLSVFSVVMKGSPTVGWVQTKLIYFTFFFVGLACFIRLYFALPLAYIGFGAVPVLIGMLVILFYLLLGSRWRRQTHEIGEGG